MKQISSDLTFTFKKIVPVILVWVLGVKFFKPINSMINQGEVEIKPLALLIIMGIAIYVFTKIFVSNLVDEAWDDGDALVLKNKGQEARIPLSNIMHISFLSSAPPRATLTLYEPCRFGKRVTFSPRWGLVLFKRQPFLDLIERVDQAKTKPS